MSLGYVGFYLLICVFFLLLLCLPLTVIWLIVCLCVFVSLKENKIRLKREIIRNLGCGWEIIPPAKNGEQKCHGK